MDLPNNKQYMYLDKILWETRGSRFNTFRRLKKQGSLSITTISVLSVYAIMISLAPYFTASVSRSQQLNNLDSFLSILLSICILVVSLLEASKEYSSKSLKIYDCANEIGKLQHKLKELEHTTDTGAILIALAEISSEYNYIINKCPENHEPIDFALFKAQNSKHYKMHCMMAFIIKIKAAFSPYAFYFLLLVAPPFIYITLRYYLL